jgi:hypothetical protein
MSTRGRKLVGVLATVGFLVIYSLVAMAAGGQFVMGSGKVIELIYFVLAGVAWVPAVMIIIKWMSGSNLRP